MSKTLENKWHGGRGTIEIPPHLLPKGLLNQRGMTLWGLTLSPRVGTEVVLLLVQDEPTCAELEPLDILHMKVKSGLCETKHGPVFWLLFRLLDPRARGEYITYEYPVNLSDHRIVRALADLASQEYWHLVLLDPAGAVRQFVEFKNVYGLEVGVAAAVAYLRENPKLEFELARMEYEKNYSMEDLINV
jgi:hypothetical protein